jgi:hypothetical protein
MAQTGTRSVGRNKQSDDEADAQVSDQTADTAPEDDAPVGGAFANDGDIDIDGALDRAEESADTRQRASVEDKRNQAMQDFALLAPDDYRQRMRSQTHIAAAELGSDTTRSGGFIIDRRGRKVDANGKSIKGE